MGLMWGHHDEAVIHQCVCVSEDVWMVDRRARDNPVCRELMAWTWLSSCVCVCVTSFILSVITSL